MPGLLAFRCMGPQLPYQGSNLYPLHQEAKVSTTGGEVSTTGPPGKSQKSLDLKRLRFYKHLYQTPKKNHQNANYTRKGKKLPTFREDSIKPCCPENGYIGGSLEQGRVVEGASVLNYVTHCVTVDISPDVSQLIIELPPLISSTKRMMFFSTDSSCFPSVTCLLMPPKKRSNFSWKLERLSSTSKWCSASQPSRTLPGRKIVIPCVQMGSLDAWHRTWFSCLVTCCKDSLPLTGVCVGINTL